jgi:hypothetical protein
MIADDGELPQCLAGAHRRSHLGRTRDDLPRGGEGSAWDGAPARRWRGSARTRGWTSSGSAPMSRSPGQTRRPSASRSPSRSSKTPATAGPPPRRRGPRWGHHAGRFASSPVSRLPRPRRSGLPAWLRDTVASSANGPADSLPSSNDKQGIAFWWSSGP